MKIAIVILSYNGLANTLECLDSLRRLQKPKGLVEIIVVDNGSNDGSAKAFSQLKEIYLISNVQNLGYSGGNNLGIKRALEREADYILVLNNDTIAHNLMLLELIQSLQEADIASPKIYFAPGFEFHKERYRKQDLGKVIWYAGGEIDWPNIIGRHIGVDEVDHGQYEKTRQIDLATGAAMLVKRGVFEKLGLFDEKYFLYLEDMDFCVRAKKAGFKITYEPKAILWHKNAGSAGGSGSALQDYYITRNRLLFAFKYAKLRTKIALLRQSIAQITNPVKRKALIDFLTGNLGEGSFSV